ncbi:MAG: phosphoribosylaminoimidazolesuccinocarboxamide synthase [Candidatus Viridilinea halotolerans]|uniref:Phosphoribosylaminoimidazole-succinocarboxamide synthase n=1 Tax=Candidatus Viridilinea halotolerans TaxID=2491704 RepID=A0A426U1K3_9CHLR|nr:MAG: phosphoribosylaminoimidazolesuccinocarboxamide synthase [Candidatus Viridilinea halotolerans]
MELGAQIIEGKTKIVYAHPDDAALCVLAHKDGITAGDGVRRNEIPGKGALAGRTTANVFRLLECAGVATHFIAAPAPTLTVARCCTMLPLEVVMRRLATGSYLRRNPEVAEGTRFDPLLVEFFLKDDAAHDPLITPTEIAERTLATPAELEQMVTTGCQVFAILETAWAKLEVTLVDLKLEFGRLPSGALIVADVIDNDSWRIWPAGEKSRMLDKQVYRNAALVDDALLAAVYARYAQVADLTDQF